MELGKKCRYLQVGDRFIRPNLHAPAGKYTLTYGNMCEYALACDHKAMLEDGYRAEQLPFYGSALLGYGPNFAPIPREISAIDGGVLLSLCECFGAVKDFGIGPGASVLVYGCGPMGLASMHIMKALGAARIVAVDRVEERLEAARDKVGVNETINFAQKGVKDAVGGEQFEFVFDAVGSAAILEEGSHFLKAGGTVCGLGVLSTEDCKLNVHKIKNNTAVHFHMYPYQRFSHVREVGDMILAGKLNPKDFYSHVVPMEDIPKAMELVKRKEALKVVLAIP